jgi:beta-lactamase regulating signal transducer with metallopeptidase domain
MTHFSEWAVDALLSSFLLALLVLAIRTPVARMFGPRIAYALWLIPALRLVLPPVPALSLPWSAAAPSSDAAAVDSAMWMSTEATGLTNGAAASDWDSALAWVPAALLLLWLGGAAVHLTRQLLAHRQLLNRLRDAEVEGWDARVCILNSRHVDGPLSLGLLKPLVVMPDDATLFLNAQERALAIRHEVMHHSRGDLWANAAAVLFAALHWFNPLMGTIWRAFRFDQEAACDADVLTGADGPTRGTYARALAKAASGRPSAFASNMMHANNLKERLSMMTLPHRSLRRRRIGVTLAATMTIGLLLATATPRTAVAQETPAAAPAPTTATVNVSREGGDHVTRIVRDDGTTIILRTDGPLDQAEIDRMVAEAEASRAQAERELGANDQAAAEHRRREVIMIRHSNRDETSATSETTSGDAANGERGQRQIIIRRSGDGHADQHTNGQPTTWRGESTFVFRMDGAGGGTVTRTSCDNDAGAERIEQNTESAGGNHVLRIVMCGMPDNAIRLSALRRAREALANMAASQLPPEARANALAEIDAQIATLSAASP